MNTVLFFLLLLLLLLLFLAHILLHFPTNAAVLQRTSRRRRNVVAARPQNRATMSPRWNGSPKWWRISIILMFFFMGNFITCWFYSAIWYVLYNALKHEHMNKKCIFGDVLATSLNKVICEVGVCGLFFGAMRDLLADPSHGRLLLSSAMSMESSRTSTWGPKQQIVTWEIPRQRLALAHGWTLVAELLYGIGSWARNPFLIRDRIK